jgi:hypothetical protein
MRRLRHWPLFVAGVVFWLCLAGAMLTAGASAPEDQSAGLMVVGTVLFVVWYLVAMGTMFSFVGLRSEGLVVRNPHRRLVVPWARVQAVSWSRGLEVEVEGLPGRLYCVAFQRSMVASVLGNPSARAAARKVEEYRDKHAEHRAGGGDGVVEGFPWRAHLVWIVVGWSLLTVVIPLFGRSVGPV